MAWAREQAFHNAKVERRPANHAVGLSRCQRMLWEVLQCPLVRAAIGELHDETRKMGAAETGRLCEGRVDKRLW